MMLAMQGRAVWPHLSRALKRVRMKMLGRKGSALPVFVVGTQRSGTKMTLKTLERSPQVWAHDHRRRDVAHLLRPDPAYVVTKSGRMARLIERSSLRELIAKTPAPVVAFHAIAESQNSVELLEEFNRSRVVWVYRRYTDVANSALVKWGDHQKDLVRRINQRRFDQLSWRGEKLPESVVKSVGDLYDPNMSAFDGACLFWYMRNQFFFDLGLESNPSVFLLQYEDFVQNPDERFEMLYRWLGLSYDRSFVDHIFASSVGRKRPPEYADSTRALCDPLQSRLDAAYSSQIERLATTSPAAPSYSSTT